MPIEKVSASQVVRISFDASRWRLPNRLLLLREQLDLELLDNGVGDFVLDRENVGQVTVIAVGPNVAAVLAMDELSGNAPARAGPSNASFEHKVDSKVLNH